MRCKPLHTTVVITALLFSMNGCSVTETICPLVELSAIAVSVRDTSGQPAAKGATATVEKPGYKASSLGFVDPLWIEVGDEGGTLAVTVTKPYYRSQTISSVEVSEGRCGVTDTASVDFVIALEPNAPPVRQVVLYPEDVTLSSGDSTSQMVYVDADAGVSKDVVWSSADESVATVDSDGRITATCNVSTESTAITATSVVDVNKSDSIEVVVEATGRSLCS